ncbi:hypothetical protein E2R60_20685 [Paenibacillus dendritiformis]|uniref:DUF6148 family protein n=1 Tax=Paenibacillus dendritiformis TaxID=130049 RepID=UPI001059CEB5|nr:DUF6148 family protein [Paenibacillus dendritiformis]TDL50964.1 hypothetical protein E2R60_20685 [Paenibacillus dendritiformis]
MPNRPRYSLEVAQQHLNAWLAAELAISSAQSYKIGTRSLTRADLKDVMKQIQYWQEQVDLAMGIRKNRVRRYVPLDT